MFQNVCVCVSEYEHICVYMCRMDSKAVRGQVRASENLRVVSFPTFQSNFSKTTSDVFLLHSLFKLPYLFYYTQIMKGHFLKSK